MLHHVGNTDLVLMAIVLGGRVLRFVRRLAGGAIAVLLLRHLARLVFVTLAVAGGVWAVESATELAVRILAHLG